jgi:hypothetical protein
VIKESIARVNQFSECGSSFPDNRWWNPFLPPLELSCRTLLYPARVKALRRSEDHLQGVRDHSRLSDFFHHGTSYIELGEGKAKSLLAALPIRRVVMRAVAPVNSSLSRKYFDE